MKIGLIADTHLKQATRELEELLAGAFHEVEMILHAGDITELATLEAFKGKEVLAVCGNMDSAEARQRLPSRRTIQAGNFRIGLIHGWGGPQGIEERIRREFDDIDCIIYGHTHTPSERERDGVLFFNPGAFGSGFSAARKSVGLLEVGEAISGRILYL